MGLIRKRTTSALVAANKANARKSTGPRTELGRSHSSRNAGKHLVYAKVAAHSMKELGEDPAEFEKLRESLRCTFQPQDGFEEMLVEDMIVTRWRLGRARRAEMGILAVQQFRLEHCVRATPANRQAMTISWFAPSVWPARPILQRSTFRFWSCSNLFW